MSYLEVKTKILLDTTYLLPIIGVEVEEIRNTLTVLKTLFDRNIIEVYYTPFNIMEVIGKISRISYDEERVKLGLRSIREAFKLTYPTMKGYLKALKLRRRGFKDLIDLLLYATALTRRILFLTRDVELIEFLSVNNENLSVVLREDEFLSKYGKLL